MTYTKLLFKMLDPEQFLPETRKTDEYAEYDIDVPDEFMRRILAPDSVVKLFNIQSKCKFDYGHNIGNVLENAMKEKYKVSSKIDMDLCLCLDNYTLYPFDMMSIYKMRAVYRPFDSSILHTYRIRIYTKNNIDEYIDACNSMLSESTFYSTTLADMEKKFISHILAAANDMLLHTYGNTDPRRSIIAPDYYNYYQVAKPVFYLRELEQSARLWATLFSIFNSFTVAKDYARILFKIIKIVNDKYEFYITEEIYTQLNPVYRITIEEFAPADDIRFYLGLVDVDELTTALITEISRFRIVPS